MCEQAVAEVVVEDQELVQPQMIMQYQGPERRLMTMLFPGDPDQQQLMTMLFREDLARHQQMIMQPREDHHQQRQMIMQFPRYRNVLLQQQVQTGLISLLEILMPPVQWQIAVHVVAGVVVEMKEVMVAEEEDCQEVPVEVEDQDG